LGFDAPQPSLDGKRIFAVGAQLRAELSRYDQKSNQFLPYLGGISAMGVSFSPDGQWVAYFSFPDGQLWRSRIDGSEKLQLTSSPSLLESARWSPDGRQIAYVSSQPGQTDRLCLVGKDGGSPRVLFETNGMARPSWRRDGRAIVVSEAPTVPEKGELKQVDSKSGQVNTVPGSIGLIFPVVSPDGRYLAAGAADSRKLKLYDFSTQAWQEFAPPTGVGRTEWAADSRYLYFDNGLSADPAVYRFRIADHKVELVTSLKNFRRAQWGDLPWFGLTPNGDPLLMRDVGSQEVYALDFEEP
jgi:Tol biopolymer transport system component